MEFQTLLKQSITCMVCAMTLKSGRWNFAFHIAAAFERNWENEVALIIKAVSFLHKRDNLSPSTNNDNHIFRTIIHVCIIRRRRWNEVILRKSDRRSRRQNLLINSWYVTGKVEIWSANYLKRLITKLIVSN